MCTALDGPGSSTGSCYTTFTLVNARTPRPFLFFAWRHGDHFCASEQKNLSLSGIQCYFHWKLLQLFFLLFLTQNWINLVLLLFSLWLTEFILWNFCEIYEICDNFKPKKKKANSSALVFDTIYSYGMSNAVTIWGKVGLNNFFCIWRPTPPSG